LQQTSYKENKQPPTGSAVGYFLLGPHEGNTQVTQCNK